MADDCGWMDVGCQATENVKDAVSGVAGNAVQAVADAVRGALIKTITELGTLWTTIDSGDLTAGGGGSTTPVSGGVFNTRVNELLGYATWIGLAVTTIAVILLGITIAANARRGDGEGLINRATLVFGGASLIGGATALPGFLVPQRSTLSSPTVGFIQDQTFYLTLALASLSAVIAGVRMVWSQRAEAGQELMKGLLTLAVVTASGVVMLNVLLKATDSLAGQIIDAAIGTDFEHDVQVLLGLNNTDGGTGNFLMGDAMLIIIGGLIAVIVNIVQIMLMVLRTAMLFLIAGVLPLSASFMNTEPGKQWFSKIVAWTTAFAFYKPAAALVYATGIKLTTSGLFSGQALLQFSAGLMLIIASVVALPVLISFLSTTLSAVSSSGGGGGGAIGAAAVGAAALPTGASGSRGRGQGFPPAPPEPAAPQGSRGAGHGPGNAGPTGANPAGGAAGPGAAAGSPAAAGAGAGGSAAGAGASGGAAAAGGPLGAAVIAGQAVKKGADAVSGAAAGSARNSGDPPAGTAPGGGGPSGTPGAPPAAKAPAPDRRPPGRPQSSEPTSRQHGNEDGPDGADR